jgi:hypothetical protein
VETWGGTALMLVPFAELLGCTSLQESKLAACYITAFPISNLTTTCLSEAHSGADAAVDVAAIEEGEVGVGEAHRVVVLQDRLSDRRRRTFST